MDTGHRHYLKVSEFSKLRPIEAQTGNFVKRDDAFISDGEELHREVMTVCAARRKAETIPLCQGFHFKGAYTTKPVEVIFKSSSKSVPADEVWTSYEFRQGKLVLTVHVMEHDAGLITFTCTNIAGDEMAAVSVDESKSVGDLRTALAAELDDEAFEIMTPDGIILSDGKASLEVLQ